MFCLTKVGNEPKSISVSFYDINVMFCFVVLRTQVRVCW